MYKIDIETADTVFNPINRVFVTLKGELKDGDEFEIDGTLFDRNKITSATWSPSTPDKLGLIKSVQIRLDSPNPWQPVRVAVDDDVLKVKYEALITIPSMLDKQSLKVDLKSDITTPSGEVSFDDVNRSDLTRKLLSIQRNEAVRITFNHDVNLATFDPTRDNGRARSLSIRSMDNVNGAKTNLSEELSATNVGPFMDWTKSANPLQLSANGTYLWEDLRNFIIAPPHGGWPDGKFIRFEFDRSLTDTSGNSLRDKRDQVVFLLVSARVDIRIDSPIKKTTYLKWESGDIIEGKVEDFFVAVSGTVTQEGGSKHIKGVHVSARNENGTVLTVNYFIPAGPTGYNRLTDPNSSAPKLSENKIKTSPNGDLIFDKLEVGSKWEPNNAFGGKWTINLPLRDFDYAGTGAQAVAEKRYKWTIEATAITDDNVRVQTVDSDKRIVYHEIFKPRVTRVTVVQGSRVVYEHVLGQAPVEKPLILKGADVGPITYLVEACGDFEDASSFNYGNTYEDTPSKVFLGTNIDHSDDVPEGSEEATITLPTFIVDNDSDALAANGKQKNCMTHTIVFNGMTRARSPISLPIKLIVDTVPLDVINAEPVKFGR